MGTTSLVALAILVAIAVFATIVYNKLVTLRNGIGNAFAQIDVQLKRRYDLIPNLVEAVKGYASHERQTFEAVTAAREKAAASAGSPGAQARDEQALVASVNKLLAVAESYPDLKASGNFLQLQKELANTEDRIQAARRFYNGNVRDLNTRIAVFPSSLVASMFGFKPAEFFEVESTAVRQVVDVSFNG